MCVPKAVCRAKYGRTGTFSLSGSISDYMFPPEGALVNSRFPWVDQLFADNLAIKMPSAKGAYPIFGARQSDLEK